MCLSAHMTCSQSREAVHRGPLRENGAVSPIDYDLYKLGWRAFQDLCGVILQQVLGKRSTCSPTVMTPGVTVRSMGTGGHPKSLVTKSSRILRRELRSLPSASSAPAPAGL